MKRRSRTSGKPTKGRGRKAAKPTTRNPPKGTARSTSSSVAEKTEVGRLTRELNEALERQAATSQVLHGVMVVFNDPVPVENPTLQTVLMALEMRDAIGALTERWRRLGHDIGFGIGHGFAALGTIGFEGRFDYDAIGTVSNVASRLCDEAKPGQILISPRVLMAVEKAVTVEPIGEFALPWQRITSSLL